MAAPPLSAHLRKDAERLPEGGTLRPRNLAAGMVLLGLDASSDRQALCFASDRVEHVRQVLGPAADVVAEGLAAAGGASGPAPLDDWPLKHARHRWFKPAVQRDPERGLVDVSWWFDGHERDFMAVRSAALFLSLAARPRRTEIASRCRCLRSSPGRWHPPSRDCGGCVPSTTCRSRKCSWRRWRQPWPSLARDAATDPATAAARRLMQGV